jgi:hypothetical protein
MGYVVTFTPRAVSQPTKLSAGEAAAIIIFPGVRYERVPDSRPTPGVTSAALPHPPKH